MATRPATTPEAAPRDVEAPSRSRSTSSQPSMAAPVATSVLTQTYAATPSAVRKLAPLKPNQPNHSRPAPSMTSGRLLGRIGSLPKPLRLPRTSARASAAAPALMWTAVPPARSMVPMREPIQPPSSSSSPWKANTQCATGKYTTEAQTPAKTIQEPNLARSAIAPEIRATVMIANTAWKATNARVG